MMKVNVNTTPTLTIIVETFRSDKNYFGQTKPISLSDRMTDRSSDNLAQTVIFSTTLTPLARGSQETMLVRRMGTIKGWFV
jgi:hypothetical protein